MCIYCGTTKYRKIYENHYGPIPKDKEGRTYEIHHIDGNHSNNDPDNLKAVTIQEHYDIHYAQKDYWSCLMVSKRMKMNAEEISKLASKLNNERVANGTHPWAGEAGTSLQKKRIVEGIHPSQTGCVKLIHEKWMKDGVHPFMKRRDGSSIGRTNMLKMIEDGSHPFMSGEIQRKNNEKMLAEGSHPFMKRPDGSSLSSDMVKNGTHNMLGGDIQRKSNQRRIKEGTHHLLAQNNPQIINKTHHFFGGEIQRKNNEKMLAEGSHPSQQTWTCEHCNKTGKGLSNYIRWHGLSCKKILTVRNSD